MRANEQHPSMKRHSPWNKQSIPHDWRTQHSPHWCTKPGTPYTEGLVLLRKLCLSTGCSNAGTDLASEESRCYQKPTQILNAIILCYLAELSSHKPLVFLSLQPYSSKYYIVYIITTTSGQNHTHQLFSSSVLLFGNKMVPCWFFDFHLERSWKMMHV